MSVQPFSSGYYTLTMNVQPYSGGPVIERGLYEYINTSLYSRTDAPVTMRLSLRDGAHFIVGAENAVPPSVLAVPASWVENIAKSADGGRQTVFILRPEHSNILNQVEDIYEYRDNS